MYHFIRTVAVCPHDDAGGDELQHSQGVVERLIFRHVHSHDAQQSVMRFGEESDRHV
jgi:hypothetical protein